MGTAAAAAAGDAAAPSRNDLQFADADEEDAAAVEIKLGSSGCAAAPPRDGRKRPRDDDGDDGHGKIPAAAHRHRLSKWAARLFDPDRPRGLVEPPRVIPLNDEFLRAFGRRERAHDELRGVAALPIERAIDGDGDDDKNGDDDTDEDELAKTAAAAAAHTPKNSGSRKIKISNLKYTLHAAQVEAACSQFGAVQDCRLPTGRSHQSAASGSNSNNNSGFAYVVFEEAVSARACADQLQQIGGRPVSVTIVATGSSSSQKHHSNAARYWQTGSGGEPDLSAKCVRCGGVGHRAADCASATVRTKPCVLCASLEHSEVRRCPCAVICFHCGRPGHVIRDCPQRAAAARGGAPPPHRRICTVCFQSSHHKVQCRFNTNHAQSLPPPPPGVQQAVCLTCGQTGHYLCRPLKWFFGLEGVSCSNCGMPGHIGAFCQRPNLDVCGSNEDVARQEIERAATVSSVEESLIAANSGRNNGNSSNSNNNRQGGNQRGGTNNGARTGGGGRGQPQQDRGRSDNRQQQQQQQQQQPYRRFNSMPPRGRSDNGSNRSSPAKKGRWGPKSPPQRRNNNNNGGGGRY